MKTPSVPDLRDPFASLRGGSAVVTGAARGIGFEIAESLLSVGMTVVLLDRDAGALQTAGETLREAGPTASVVCDLSSDVDLPRASEALRTLPPLRLWVNNAGVVRHHRAEELDIAAFETMMRDNASSALRGSQLAYRHMVASDGGAIVNVASIAVDKVLPDRLAYAASKSAVISISRYAAQEWGPSGIRVNVVCPGYISTRLTQWRADDPKEIAKQETVARLAARRVGQPSDIARAVLFLGSDLASYVNGDVLYVDGGWHLL